MAVMVRMGDERATLYAEGGIGFEAKVPGVGWVVEDSPTSRIVLAALAVRGSVFPSLLPPAFEELVGTVGESCEHCPASGGGCGVCS